MADWFKASGTAGFSDDDDDVVDAPNANGVGASGGDGDGKEDLNAGSMLRFASVTDVTSFFRSELPAVLSKPYLSDDLQSKNSITKDDPEHDFLQDCSRHCLTIEVEKSKVHKFIRDHYGVRFPELATLCTDPVQYAEVVLEIGNNADDLSKHVEKLRETMQSQKVCAACACSATTAGRALTESELGVVFEACEEMRGLEDAKQTLLTYIQQRTPLVLPNVSSFIGAAIASQLFAIAGSVTALAHMDATDIGRLGSKRGTSTGFHVKTAGFLINADLVACHPPELRQKALRMVAARVSTLSRIDDNRRAADRSEGERAREELKRRMLEWTDPIVQQVQSRLRGLSNKTYERRTRKRAINARKGGRYGVLAGAGGGGGANKKD